MNDINSCVFVVYNTGIDSKKAFCESICPIELEKFLLINITKINDVNECNPNEMLYFQLLTSTTKNRKRKDTFKRSLRFNRHKIIILTRVLPK
ncbi:hypothetical protein ACNO6G_11945 [Vibrio harveyi]|uniref:hypothetical protein n=1 Tax=Vibrio harveyi TaxID=669 RepID=UPI003AAAAB2E